VRVYSWKLILAREGIVTWLAERLGLRGLLEAVLALPVIGGPSLSTSHLGTFLVFLYVWLPFMILPVFAALERIPHSYIEASRDLGASGFTTMRRVILPLALPGIVAGSIFTFSLTLGDYITPTLVGGAGSTFIGNIVYSTGLGVSGNLPFAAAFAAIPVVIMGIYLTLAKRTGAFDAL
jgi:putative spermidine/putrescine transport system permease protein